MSERAKVAIVVPVYNVEKYVAECLESCIKQTLTDIEIICVNDGSTDNSLDILKEYARKDYRIQIIDKPNGGLSSARNAGIKAAYAEWIMYLDSDDYLDLNACEVVWTYAQHHYTEIITYGAKIYPERPKYIPWLKNVLSPREFRYEYFIPRVLFAENGAWPFVWRQAFSKEFLDRTMLLFDERVRYGEDTIFQFSAFPQANHILFISEQIYNYRHIREGSLMATAETDSDRIVELHMDIVDYIGEYWQSRKWIEYYGKYFLNWYLLFIVYDLKNRQFNDLKIHIKRANEQIDRLGLSKYVSRLGIRAHILWSFVRFRK